MLRNGVRLGQSFIAGPAEPTWPWQTEYSEGFKTVDTVGYGGLLRNVWFGVLLWDEEGTARPLGSQDDYSSFELAHVEAMAFGTASYAAVDPAAGSARWDGVMVGRDVGMPVVTALNLIQGDATLEYDFTGMNVDVTFDNVKDITAGTNRQSMTWADIPVEDWGEFEDAGADGDYIMGMLYGQNHAEAAGVFERNSIVGAFGASTSSRFLTPAADEVYVGLADKVADAARYNRKYDGEVELTGWNFVEWRNPDSGSEQVTWSQSYRDGFAVNSTVPWHGSDGQLRFHFDAYGPVPIQEEPVAVYTGRFISLGDHYLGARSDVTTSPVDVALDSSWEGLRATQTYSDGATLEVDFVTDLGQTETSASPWIRDFSGHVDNIELNGVDSIPADRDYLWIPVPDAGVSGALDGVAGQFTCAAGPECGFVLNPEDPADPGYYASMDMTFTPDDGSATVAVLRAEYGEAVPRTDYLAFGSWQFVPEDTENPDGFEFGVFASGGDPFDVTRIRALTGSARYQGQATGKYARAPALGGTEIESFTADVELTADFGTSNAFGEIDGTLSNLEMAGGGSAPLTELGLEARSWRDDENIFESYEGGPPLPGGWVDGFTQGAGDDGRWSGAWGGAFFGNDPASANAHPTGFAGTFGASDGANSVAGSFGAHRQ